MGERKVLNKYYPPDFDATKLKKNHRPKDKQDVVRMMLPMTIRCNTCGNYLYIGTKFNMRKETALNEEYLGIKIYRFYFKCTVCYAELTFKTDPKNHDYVVEHGGSRNYEPWRDAQSAETLMKEIREKEEEGNAMKYLENKTYDSKREMEMLDALDEIKELNKRKAKITVDQLLEGVILDNEKQEQEDREISKLVFKERTTKRLIENNDDTELVPESKSLFQGLANVLSQPGKSSASSAGKLIPRHLVVRSKNVCKDEKPSLNLLRAKGIVPQMEVLTIESSGESHSGSLQSHTQLTNKMASLLNYSDDE